MRSIGYVFYWLGILLMANQGCKTQGDSPVGDSALASLQVDDLKTADNAAVPFYKFAVTLQAAGGGSPIKFAALAMDAKVNNAIKVPPDTYTITLLYYKDVASADPIYSSEFCSAEEKAKNVVPLVAGDNKPRITVCTKAAGTAPVVVNPSPTPATPGDTSANVTIAPMVIDKAGAGSAAATGIKDNTGRDVALCSTNGGQGCGTLFMCGSSQKCRKTSDASGVWCVVTTPKTDPVPGCSTH